MTVQIGSVPQLFLDDRVIAGMERCRRQLHRPTRVSDSPVVAAEEPWETGPRRNGVYVFGGTVLFDEERGRYRMWYRTSEVELGGRPKDPSTTVVNSIDGPVPYGGYRSCYAESADGLAWEKPDLGLVEYEGTRRTNILPPGTGGPGFIRRPNLIVDYEEPDPDRRFKMAYADDIDGRWVLRTAWSPDGIRWEMGAVAASSGVMLGPQPPYYPLGVLMGWDPGHRRFVHFHRKVAPGLRVDVDGRSVRAEEAQAVSTSLDFERWEPAPDIEFRLPGVDPPGWDIGHAGMLAAFPYTHDLYLGFLDTVSSLGVDSAGEDPDGRTWAALQTEHEEHRPELVMSRDGVRWTRVMPHWPWLRRGLPGTWDCEYIVLSKAIVRDDDILIPYTGRNLTCGVQHEGHPQFERLGTVVDGQRLGSAVGMARLRRDGFASIDGYEDGGTLTTVPLAFEGDRLVINARAPESAGGRLSVEVLDAEGRTIEGYGAAECDAFSGDAIRHVVTWGGRSDVGRLAGDPIALRFHLHNAALYAFRFRGEHEAPSEINLLAPGARGTGGRR